MNQIIVSPADILVTMRDLAGQTDSLLDTTKLLQVCASHESMRTLVKDLLVELRSKETEDNKELINRAQAVVTSAQ